MRLDAKDADLALADAFWWLHGFTSAQPTNTEAGDAVARIGRVRNWLQELLQGDHVVISANGDMDDRMGWRAVISQADFETVFDALRDGADDNERTVGRATVEKALARIKHEVASLTDPEF